MGTAPQSWNKVRAPKHWNNCSPSMRPTELTDLKARRLTLQYTQQDLEAKTGISQSAISKIERRGETARRSPLFRKLDRVLTRLESGK